MFIVLILFLLGRIVLLTIEILRGWGRGERLPPLPPSSVHPVYEGAKLELCSKLTFYSTRSIPIP